MYKILLLVILCSIKTDGQPYLRDLVQKYNKWIGSAANYYALTSNDYQDKKNYTSVLSSQFNLVTPENAMKWQGTEPQQNYFTYDQGDTIVSFAKANNQIVRGHNLAWGVYNPDWLTNGNFNSNQLNDILRNHIQNVAGHYRGQLYCWDVVNEAVRDDVSYSTNCTSPNGNCLKQNVWFPTLTNYIDLAFTYAKQTDPSAKLFYNDYSAEGMTPKSQAVYQLVQGMKSRGIPIDGVGLQMHFSLTYSPSVSDVEANIRRLTDLGLEVHITELDVQLDGGGDMNYKLKQQAQVYGDMLTACLSNSKCKSFEVWGFTDKHSWLSSSMADLYDINYQAKPAFYQLVNEL